MAIELFDQRFHEYLDKHRGAGAIAERVRTHAARGEPLERVLFDLQDRDDPDVARKLLDTQFYLQLVLWRCSAVWGTAESGANAYLTLVSELEDWRYRESEEIIFVTFNYDDLLERALSQQFPGWTFAKLSDYLRDNYAVVKVHGSANWMEVTDVEVSEGTSVTWDELVARAPQIRRTGKFIVAGPGTSQYDRFGAVPALAIPAEPKSRFVCPEDHIAALERMLPRVTKVLSIGWRGADKSLLQLLTGRVSRDVETWIVGQRPFGPGMEAVPEETNCLDAGVPWVAEVGIAGNCRVLRTGFWQFARRFVADRTGFRLMPPLE